MAELKQVIASLAGELDGQYVELHLGDLFEANDPAVKQWPEHFGPAVIRSTPSKADRKAAEKEHAKIAKQNAKDAAKAAKAQLAGEELEDSSSTAQAEPEELEELEDDEDEPIEAPVEHATAAPGEKRGGK